MAIARGAGTEILRSIHARDIDTQAAGQTLIRGVQHHIYTVLSIIFCPITWQASGNYVRVWIDGYDAKAGATDQQFYIFQQDIDNLQTYVWNDKFSFNGYEPTDFTLSDMLITEAMQDAIADQGSSVPQYLKITTENASDQGSVTCSYIDQNNA